MRLMKVFSGYLVSIMDDFKHPLKCYRIFGIVREGEYEGITIEPDGDVFRPKGSLEKEVFVYVWCVP